jgi:hypothetical protein
MDYFAVIELGFLRRHNLVEKVYYHSVRRNAVPKTIRYFQQQFCLYCRFGKQDSLSSGISIIIHRPIGALLNLCNVTNNSLKLRKVNFSSFRFSVNCHMAITIPPAETTIPDMPKISIILILVT